MYPETVEGYAIRLRKARPEDLEDIYAAVYGAPQVLSLLFLNPSDSLESARDRLGRTIAFQADKPMYFLADRESDRAIGIAGLRQEAPGVWSEMGIALGTEFQGRGLGAETLFLLLKLAFETLGAETFVYYCMTENHRSRAMAKRFGFTYEKTTQETREHDGKTFSVERYLLTRAQFDDVHLIQEIRVRLNALRDEGYARFQAKLMPGVDQREILGVRTPELRKLAKEYARREEIGQFLSDLPHRYYDERNLHGFILSECKDYDKTLTLLEAFLPHVDNWATCDLLSPKAFRKHRAELALQIPVWMASKDTYTVRFGIEMIMTHFLDEDFDPSWLERVGAIRSEEYYINMMLAWFFATALAKQYDAAAPYLTERRLDRWVHNKTIQKAVESYRITPAQKDALRALRWK